MRTTTDGGAITPMGVSMPQRRQGNGEKGDARRTGMPKSGKNKGNAPHKRTDKGPKSSGKRK